MSKITDALRKRHQAISPKFEDVPSVKEKLPKMMVTPYFDLRGDKLSVMHSTPLCTEYMLFLNGRCTLGHVVHAMDVEDPDYSDGVPHRRQPIPRRIQGAHPEFIRRWVLQKLIRPRDGMSVFMNSLSPEQCLFIENCTGNLKYGKAAVTKGEIRQLRKVGVVDGQSYTLTKRADFIIQYCRFTITELLKLRVKYDANISTI